MIEDEISRRETLRKSAIVAGGLALGTAGAGTATAKQGGVGFLRNDPPIEHGLERGDTFTIGYVFDQSAEVLAVECEANRNARGIYTVYTTDLPSRILLWIKGNGPIDAPLPVEVNKIRECGLMTEVAGDFVGDKIMFKPA